MCGFRVWENSAGDVLNFVLRGHIIAAIRGVSGDVCWTDNFELFRVKTGAGSPEDLYLSAKSGTH